MKIPVVNINGSRLVAVLKILATGFGLSLLSAEEIALLKPVMNAAAGPFPASRSFCMALPILSKDDSVIIGSVSFPWTASHINSELVTIPPGWNFASFTGIE